MGVNDMKALCEAICTLRTALREIRNDVLDMVTNHKSEDPDSYAHGLCLSIGGACDMALNSTKEFDNADKALSAPPRNCDVGTAEEQIQRHSEWYDRYGCGFTDTRKECSAKWANIPYKEGSYK